MGELESRCREVGRPRQRGRRSRTRDPQGAEPAHKPSGLRLGALLLVFSLAWLAPACDDGGPKAPIAPEPVAPAPATQAAAPQRVAPNLVLITLDTTRVDALGIYGQPREGITPEIDRMAREGVLFLQAVSSSPLTLPSHASILSGKHPYAHGVRSNFGYKLPEANVTLAEVLKSRGYRTAAEVSVDVLRSETRIGQGFDSYRTPDSPGVTRKTMSRADGTKSARPIRPGFDVTQRGLEFLRRHRDERFFLWLHYFDAHQPLTPSAQAKARFPKSPYHAAVADEDAAVGQILREIEKLGLKDRTLVVLTADHGESMGDHGEDTHSYFVYDSTMHVPLVFWGLGRLRPGRVVDAVVRTIDIAPTVVDLMRLPPLKNVQGVSVADLLTGGSRDPGLLAYGESRELASIFGVAPLRFVRQGRWKYIHKVNAELFDLEVDPGERTNRAQENPEQVAALRGRLEALLSEAPAPPTGATLDVGGETAAELAALGYVTGAPQPNAKKTESLELRGADPVSMTDDLRLITQASFLKNSGQYAEALERIEPVLGKYEKRAFVVQMHAEILEGLGRDGEAIDAYRRAFRMNPCDEVSLSRLNALYRQAGEHATLVGVLADGARKCPQSAFNLNNYAWALATLPEDGLRDGARAVESAQAALALIGSRTASYLDTLAAALAEAGRFEDAVRTQEEALRALEYEQAPAAFRADFQSRLDAYRKRVPARDPAA